MTTTKPKTLITKRAREMIIDTLKKPNPTAGNLRWVHYLIERAMEKHGIKPYPRKAGR